MTELEAILIREAYLIAFWRVVYGSLAAFFCWRIGKTFGDLEGNREFNDLVTIAAWIVGVAILVWTIASASYLVINPEVWAWERMQ